jgi:hypothetical protein
VALPALPPMDKKSQTPSVEARVAGTKQQFRKSKEGTFYSIYISFTGFLFFLSLSSISSCFVVFLIYLARTFFFWRCLPKFKQRFPRLPVAG